MKNLTFATILLSALLFYSCSQTGKEIEDLKAEVMAVHDHDAMPKMQQIMSYSKRLKEELATLDENEEEMDEKKATIDNAILELKSANDAMMNWMRNYDSKMENMSDEEKVGYLKREKEAIHAVNKQMDDAIASAQEILGE